MSSELINAHKRMAMGKGYAQGGRVAVTGAGPTVTRPTGKSQSALTTARHNNGVPGMCSGGKMKGGKR
jgi:hypothetical protein